MAIPCPTCPTGHEEVGQRFSPDFIGQSDLSDLSDRKTQGWGKNSICLSSLAARWRSEMDHDEAEAAAMAEHYAAPGGPVLPKRDPLAEGLARGFWAHRGGRPDGE